MFVRFFVDVVLGGPLVVTARKHIYETNAYSFLVFLLFVWFLRFLNVRVFFTRTCKRDSIWKQYCIVWIVHLLFLLFYCVLVFIVFYCVLRFTHLLFLLFYCFVVVLCFYCFYCFIYCFYCFYCVFIVFYSFLLCFDSYYSL